MTEGVSRVPATKWASASFRLLSLAASALDGCFSERGDERVTRCLDPRT